MTKKERKATDDKKAAGDKPVGHQVKNTKAAAEARKRATAAEQVMSKKIRYAGEVFSGYNKPKTLQSQEVCCPGQGQERQGQDRPLW